jgi:hypothetical protein
MPACHRWSCMPALSSDISNWGQIFCNRQGSSMACCGAQTGGVLGQGEPLYSQPYLVHGAKSWQRMPFLDVVHLPDRGQGGCELAVDVSRWRPRRTSVSSLGQQLLLRDRLCRPWGPVSASSGMSWQATATTKEHHGDLTEWSCVSSARDDLSCKRRYHMR